MTTYATNPSHKNEKIHKYKNSIFHYGEEKQIHTVFSQTL